MNDGANESISRDALIVRAAAQLCALPLQSVVETMRPLPLRPLPGLPDFVMGASLIRGQLTPVVDCSRLLGGAGGTPKRLVTLRVEGTRAIALAVEAVEGVRTLAATTASALAPLLQSADAAVVSSISVLDADLLLVLQASRLVPDDVWQALQAGTPTA
jgi:purine-binding chemotaxis protein CheW